MEVARQRTKTNRWIYITPDTNFIDNLEFDIDECFLCTNCGKDPEYFVGDGKANIAPAQSKLKNISELAAHPQDNSTLSQGSKHKDRTFISDNNDRKKLTKLFTEEQNLTEFCDNVILDSANANLVRNVLIRLKTRHDEIPGKYIKFLTEVSKNSAVVGYLQFTKRKAVKVLKDYCLQKTNIRDGNHNSELQLI